MIEVQSVKAVTLNPASFTNGQTASLTIDRLGADYASFILTLGTAGTTAAPTTLKVQSGDTTNASSFADISGATFTSTYTAANTAGQDNLLLGISLQTQARYLKLLMTPATTQILAATCVLSRLNQTPINNTAYGTSAAPIFLTGG